MIQWKKYWKCDVRFIFNEENTCGNEVFCSTIKRNLTYWRPCCWFITYSIVKKVQMPEAAIGGALRQNVFFKMSQNSQEAPLPEETPANFGKFLWTPFLQSNSGWLFLKCVHCNNQARDCICCRELDAMLYCFG